MRADDLKRYLKNILVCVLVVLPFAAIQTFVVYEMDHVEIRMVMVPIVLGICFGILLTRLQILRQRMAWFLTFYDLSSEGILLLDHQGVVLMANQAAGRLFEMDQAVLVGRVALSFLQTDSVDTVWSDHPLGKALRDHRTVHGEQQWFVGGGRHKFLGNYSQTRVDYQTFHGAVWMITDVSEQQHSEKILAYASELERFAHVASHDLQEPVRVIQNMVDMAVEEESERVMWLGRIKSTAHHIRSMVESLLVYHNVAHQQRHLSEVDVCALLTELEGTLSFLMDQTQGRLLVQGNLQILADAGQMRQLLWHLLYNALKFHRPDVPPDVRVTLRRSAEGQGEIVICDNGIGFDQRQEKDIFSPFKRLHHYRNYSGSGIGLSLCRKIMDTYHGRIQVVSEKGQGASFTLVFPSACFKTSV